MFIVWSNALFIIPFAMSLMFQLWGIAFLIIGASVSSFVYHNYGGVRMLMIDRLLGILLILVDLLLTILGHFVYPYIIFVTLFWICGMYFYLNKEPARFNVNHGMWHGCLACITFFSLLTFRMGM
jgi:hypothetical protein